MNGSFVIINPVLNNTVITNDSFEMNKTPSSYSFIPYCNPSFSQSKHCDSPASLATSSLSCSSCSTALLSDCTYSSTLQPLQLSYPSSPESTVLTYTATPVDIADAYEGAIVLKQGDIPYPPVKKETPKDKVYRFGCCYMHCDFECETANEMREHFKDHPGKHQYRCLYPGCKFVSCVLKDMNYHRGYHTGERPFLCTFPHCGFAAPNQSQLRLHMISHSDDKPYKCSYPNCLYVTRYKSALINHERTHTGEKPYRCKYCKTFSAKQKSGLQYHIKTVHMCK